MRITILVLAIVLMYVSGACRRDLQPPGSQTRRTTPEQSAVVERPPIDQIESDAIRRLLESAHQQVKTATGYSQDYIVIPYPGGDVPPETGACTDVIIRAFRNAGIDLQKEVHEDMLANFSAYPRKWGLSRPDTNIDHRRVPNLQTYFARKGKSLSTTRNPSDYRPGDVVSWDLDNKGTTHIGLVSNIWNERTEHYLIIHNIGAGTQVEDRMFEWKITGQYRFFP